MSACTYVCRAWRAVACQSLMLCSSLPGTILNGMSVLRVEGSGGGPKHSAPVRAGM